MLVRPFRKEDAATLGEIFHLAVHATPEREYSQQQRRAWSVAPISAQAYLARIAKGGHIVFVAVTGQDKPLGFIELQPDGRIDCFYRHPDHKGAGIGQCLYDHLENDARKRSLPRLHVEASDAARRFFLRQGFRVLERQRVARAGVSLHNTRMDKQLS